MCERDLWLCCVWKSLENNYFVILKKTVLTDYYHIILNLSFKKTKAGMSRWDSQQDSNDVDFVFNQKSPIKIQMCQLLKPQILLLLTVMSKLFHISDSPCYKQELVLSEIISSSSDNSCLSAQLWENQPSPFGHRTWWQGCSVSCVG